MSKTTTAANVILNYYCRATTPSALTPYLALFTNVETPTEPVGNNYARVQMTTSNFGSAAASGTIANTAAIAFPQASGSWGDIIGIGVYDASTAGTLQRKAYMVSGLYRLFSGAASGNLITTYGHAFVNGDRVVALAVAGATLPTGLTQGTLYHVISATATTIQVSTTGGGAAVSLSTNGLGRIVKVIPQTVSATFVPTFATGSLVFTEY